MIEVLKEKMNSLDKSMKIEAVGKTNKSSQPKRRNRINKQRNKKTQSEVNLEIKDLGT